MLRSSSHCRHVALKLYIDSKLLGTKLDNEINIYKRLEAGPKSHLGYGAVRSLLDSFDVDGPYGYHKCLVHPPLSESVASFVRRKHPEGLPAPLTALVLKRLFSALDFLHRECQVIHTGRFSNFLASLRLLIVVRQISKQIT